MRITYFPQRSDRAVSYTFDGEAITATLDGVTDTFNFSSLPDGEAAEIVSVLNPCPVLAAKRVDGELHITLLRAIPARPSDPQELEVWKRLWTDDLEVTVDG